VDIQAAQLRAKYLPIVAQAIGSRKAATFAQLERRISMLIDLQLASKVPLVQGQNPNQQIVLKVPGASVQERHAVPRCPKHPAHSRIPRPHFNLSQESPYRCSQAASQSGSARR
jgi:hypothetical protein